MDEKKHKVALSTDSFVMKLGTYFTKKTSGLPEVLKRTLLPYHTVSNYQSFCSMDNLGGSGTKKHLSKYLNIIVSVKLRNLMQYKILSI